MGDAQRGGVYRVAWRNDAARWTVLAGLPSRVGDFMYSVALVAVVFGRTGSATDVAVSAVLTRIPMVVLPTFTGVLVDRFERRRVMVTLDWACTAVMVVLTVLTATKAPVAAIVAVAVLMSSLTTPYGPAQVALVATVVGEDDLAATNAVLGAVDSAALLVGPAIGGAILLSGSPSLAFAIDAGTFVVSALCLLRVRRGPTPTASGERERGEVTAGFVALKGDGSLMVVSGALIATCFTVGATSVLFLVVSVHRMGTGAHGYGYLLAAAGLGGIVASALGDRIVRARRLALVTTVALAIVGVTFIVLAGVQNAVEGCLVTAVWGAAYILLEVLAVTLLQRCVDSDVLGRAMSAVDTLAFAAVVAGAAVAGPVSQHVGLTAALVVVAAPSLAVALVVGARQRSLDSQSVAAAAALAPRLALLSTVGVLAGGGRPTLEALAGKVQEDRVAAGDVVVRQGDPAKDFYVIVSGSFEVLSSGGRAQRPAHVRTLTAGDVFGEIGLVQRRPRTATVKAMTDATLFRIDGEDFLAAVGATAPVVGAIGDLASARLRRTHTEAGLT